jgi:hypothetical protein
MSLFFSLICLQYPVFVTGVGPDELFGRPQQWSNFTLDLTYNNETRTMYWVRGTWTQQPVRLLTSPMLAQGNIAILVDFDALIQGNDSRVLQLDEVSLPRLNLNCSLFLPYVIAQHQAGYYYQLVRPGGANGFVNSEKGSGPVSGDIPISNNTNAPLTDAVVANISLDLAGFDGVGGSHVLIQAALPVAQLYVSNLYLLVRSGCCTCSLLAAGVLVSSVGSSLLK